MLNLIIVIIVPNVIIINSLCLIHAIIMIKCVFRTTGIAIIWYGCACILNVISVTLVNNKLKFCSHIIHVLNLNGNEIVKVSRSNINSNPIAAKQHYNSDNMLHCTHCNGQLINSNRNNFWCIFDYNPKYFLYGIVDNILNVKYYFCMILYKRIISFLLNYLIISSYIMHSLGLSMHSINIMHTFYTWLEDITDPGSMSICYKRKNSVSKIFSYQTYWLLYVYNYNMEVCLSDMLHNLFVLHSYCNIYAIHIMRIAIIPYIWLYILPINTNPLTSKHYKRIHVHSKTTQSDCIVIPITAEYNTNIATNLDEYNSDSEDFNENNLINNSELYARNNFDYLENIDPDVNLLDSDPIQKCNYYSQPEFNEKFNNTNDLSILHTNIKSSKKNIKQFLWYVNNLNVTFGFIGLSEVWGGNNHTIETQSIPGYTHTYDVRTKRNGGGVSLYV